MAAYGLYTHIASNKFRSMLLLAGLFLLIYVLVYAGALVAEVLMRQRPAGRLLSDGGVARPGRGLSLCHGRRRAVDRDRLFLPPEHDRRRDRRRRA